VKFPTWEQLVSGFCSIEKDNPNFEKFARRRFNYAATLDKQSCRMIFLRGVLSQKTNKTLYRNGRFIWCRNLRYEGLGKDGYRVVSFTVDKGKKRFYIPENNMMCLPSQICIGYNRYFSSKLKTFLPFSTVFGYKNCIRMMARNGDFNREELLRAIEEDCPYRPGTLISPRQGYFYPDTNLAKLNQQEKLKQEHPCGIILGRSLVENSYVSSEFYRVRFGNTTYERIHPVQMEIINEV
tara:strand:- start:1184 stop:1897 length:714 start_codon:yes stop_codon:yes gene_type:complete